VVRAAAASALGRYVYLGELEELPAAQVRRVEAVLLDVIHGDDELEVRRRALEALAFSNQPELAALITEAYASDELSMRVSAVFAMGPDGRQPMAAQVGEELESSEPEMRFEAVRAAGELELTDSASQLVELTSDEDQQVSEAAIWSLGQVWRRGGAPRADRAFGTGGRRRDARFYRRGHRKPGIHQRNCRVFLCWSSGLTTMTRSIWTMSLQTTATRTSPHSPLLGNSI